MECGSLRKSQFLASTILSAASICAAAAAHAQTPSAPQTPQVPEAQPATQVGDVVVTGSRIPRPNLEQPTPVATISEEAIATSGTQDLGQIIAELPAFSSVSSVRGNSDSFDNDGGLNFANLRALGSARTLTLVDGKRHVGGSPGSAAVDLSSIPAALVERVETITGGASAVYGSDAVTGVVNIILKDDFEGVDARVEASTSEDGVGDTSNVSLVMGRNFMDGRLNVTGSLFYDQTDAVRATDIDSLDDWGTIINPLDTGPTDGIPDELFVRNVVSDFVDENGILINAFTFAVQSAFDINGNPVAQQPRTGDNSFAFGSFATDCETCFSVEDYILLVPDTDRYGANFRARLDLTDSVAAFIDAKYVRTELLDFFQPSFTFGEYFILPDNAFITPAIAAAIGGEPVLLGRFNADIGTRDNEITRETRRVVAGLRGLTNTGLADFNWELSYNNGETENEIFQRARLIPGNFEAALDSIRVGGQAVCRDQTPDLATQTSEACVPFNPFGQNNTAAAIDYVSHDATSFQKITQEVWQAIVTFDSSKFFNLQGGPLQFAAGVERREEESSNLNDPFVQSGRSESAPQPDAVGGFDVIEGFVEMNVPLLRDARFAHRLSFDAAYRYADYSTVGGTEAWKAGLVYAPIRDITFRGTYARAVRAPNITEAFLPPTSGFSSVTDPCDVNDINDDPDRAANCAAAGVPANFVSNTNQSIDSESSGNLNLSPEQATTFTVGVILQPSFIPGLALTIDRYDIQIDDAISLIDPQDIIDNCYDATGGPDPVFCSLLTRGPDNNINFVRSTYVNASALTNKGWDVELVYTRLLDAPFGWDWATGRLRGSLTATKLDELDFFAFADRPDEIDNELGELGDPEWAFKSRLTWDSGPLALTWESRYEGEAALYDVTPTPGVNNAESLSPNRIDAQWYHDFIVNYRLDDGLWRARNVELFAGVNNAFDQELPELVQGNGTSSSYELFGRRFFGGVRVRF